MKATWYGASKEPELHVMDAGLDTARPRRTASGRGHQDRLLLLLLASAEYERATRQGYAVTTCAVKSHVLTACSRTKLNAALP